MQLLQTPDLEPLFNKRLQSEKLSQGLVEGRPVRTYLGVNAPPKLAILAPTSTQPHLDIRCRNRALRSLASCVALRCHESKRSWSFLGNATAL
jgi:hypothetical protein